MLRNFKKFEFSQNNFLAPPGNSELEHYSGKIDKYIFDMLQYFNHTYCFNSPLFVNTRKYNLKIRIEKLYFQSHVVSNIEKLIMHLSIKKVSRIRN